MIEMSSRDINPIDIHISEEGLISLRDAINAALLENNGRKMKKLITGETSD